MSHKLRVRRVWISLIGSTVVAGAVLVAQERAPQTESIRAADLRADLFFLAGDALQGRLTGTPTNLLAGDYLKSRFERMGLKPAGPGGSFFQEYNLAIATLGDGNGLRVVRAGGPTLKLKPGQDYYPHRFSASGSAGGTIVFAGFGITAADRGYDDYRGDVRGKIVLVLNHEPGERDPNSLFDGVVTAESSSPLRKALFAQDKGAAGILFVDDVHNHPGPANFEASAATYWPPKPPRIERFTLATWMDRVRIPAAEISPALADTLLQSTGKTLADLARSSETSTGTTPVAIAGIETEITAAVNRHVVPDRNVVAAVEGSDPKLKDEAIIVCAHFDHNGADGDQIFNGADDDGSGTVGLLEIAEAYALAAHTGQRPRRSVIFAAWNSEERGLLGAWAFTERPTWPLDRIVAVLNMDMIGRNEEVQEGGGARFRGLDLQTAESNQNAVNVIGSSRSADLKAAVGDANRQIGLEIKLRYDNNV
ncbi:MAG: M28 family peptidase, partial [Acidobacteria bacterium]|nr:M28 family peptidase [Acidobacteriota bacterium]